RAADDAAELGTAEARIDRDGDGAEPRAGEIEREPGRRVGQPERDAVALANAELGKAAGDPAALRQQGREADRLLAPDQRRGTGRGALLEEAADALRAPWLRDRHGGGSPSLRLTLCRWQRSKSTRSAAHSTEPPFQTIA